MSRAQVYLIQSWVFEHMKIQHLGDIHNNLKWIKTNL